LAQALQGSSPMDRQRRKSTPMRLFLIQRRTWASLAAG
jgi:hypothetical protein